MRNGEDIPVPVTSAFRGKRQAGSDLCALLGGGDTLLDERVPFVTMRTLPEKFRAAIAASQADVRVQIEDRIARQLDIAPDETRRKIERRKRLPDRLVQRERMRVVSDRLEQELERIGRLSLRGQMTRERKAGAPILRIRSDQPFAEDREPFRRAHLRIRPFEAGERQVCAFG